ncbi:gluconate 2-dehydrogenase subunit 3 family protein [Heliorestis acidaminivorans]|uniref:Gluconate 2-dehydrogenase subunit 3 family protein n=1 Tax=Heliorestis acidaminivorans TaxID=553427 RepID=A0A6I0EWT8_9FIRM|nr:gluconate 2-dehydrogenase subunit 3 family protein [Heliorestis acidaminivorans]KAB2954269.1 gluconate 2-dehydrogenase subunit 3 family protein [Heliorestis acidaminivorans]
MSHYSHYPDYDVLSLINEWDDHTKEIVLKRLGPFPEPQFLEEKEVKMLRLIAKHLCYENRDDIIDWIIYFLDQRLKSNIGEHQRKSSLPQEKILIREGLKATDEATAQKYGKNFISAEIKEQFEILSSMQQGKAPMIPRWDSILQKELFDKLLDIMISAYYSHPTIWSEIGYGGPAYPRGYYRIELGWTDPWEPRRPGADKK